MHRTLRALVMASVASLAIGGVAAAQPISEPASCSGYLASYANPNNGWIIQNLVRPKAESLGVTVGDLTAAISQEHAGGIEACIPE